MNIKTTASIWWSFILL